jgi:hypothetical protein
MNASKMNKLEKIKEMKIIEKKLFNYFFYNEFSKILILIGTLLKIPKKPYNITTNQYNPDLLVYNEFINKLKELQLTEIQKKAIAFFFIKIIIFQIFNYRRFKTK